MKKLLFTEYKSMKCALLIHENRLIAAQALPENSGKIGAIYIGKVKNVVPSIAACFVEIAPGEMCFLPLKEAEQPFLLNRGYNGHIIEGDELLVQVKSESQKAKQASLSAHISLSNDIVAFSLGSRKIGFSGKLSADTKKEISEWLQQENWQKKGHLIPEENMPGLGMVVRTRAAECSREVFMEACTTLKEQFLGLFQTARHRTCYSCIAQPPTPYEAVLDQLVYPYEYTEILTDDTALYEKLLDFCKANLPDKKVRLYTDTALPLGKLYSIETKMQTALAKRVWLNSGGYLVIEPTEALTVIDVNSGKFQTNKNKEDAYYTINKEAAMEVALQLRLRNLSGIILIDFINMASEEHKHAVIDILRGLVRKDKCKTIVVDITPLGLVEITRKKSNRPLKEQFTPMNLLS